MENNAHSTPRNDTAQNGFEIVWSGCSFALNEIFPVRLARIKEGVRNPGQSPLVYRTILGCFGYS